MPRTFTRRAAVAIAAATVLLTSACGQGSSGPATKVVTIDDILPRLLPVGPRLFSKQSHK